MKITRIEQRRQRMDAVYIDGQFAANVDRETLEVYGFSEGSLIEEEQFRIMAARSDQKRARDKALWLLSHRAHTRAELIDKVARSTSRGAAEQAVARMEELGMVDDTDYARQYAVELTGRRGYAARRVVQELRRKGIDPELADEVVRELELNPSEQIHALLEGKCARTLMKPGGKDKTAAMLRRYGFSWSEIRPCLEEWLSKRPVEQAGDREENGEKVYEEHKDRIRYLLETKYSHALGSEKERKRAVNALVARGFSRLQVERVMQELCGSVLEN